MPLIEREGNEKRKLSHDNDLCVGCGICSDTCPTDALRLGAIVPIARGILNMDYVSVNNDKCVLCGLCASSCPFGALDLEIDGESIKDLGNYPVWTHSSEIDEEECIYCGKCSDVCPQDAVFFTRELPDINDLLVGTVEVLEDDCIYCSVCAELCPVSAITIGTDPVSGVPNSIEVDESKCVYCGVCKRVCPESAIRAVCTTCMHAEEIEKPTIEGTAFIESKCVNCGWCKSICPTGAASVTKPFDGEIARDPELVCKGDTCHACKDVCPCNAIEIIDGASVINPEFCTLCGACTKACPQHLLSAVRKEMKLENINSASWKEILGNLTQ